MIIEENYKTPWSKSSAREFDSWHSMCSYLGAFPPTLANYIIRYFSSENDIVYDPFCGRGTTGLEARVLNRQALSTDLNPIALALSEAKNAELEKSDILDRINSLESKYDYALYQPEAVAQPDDIHLIFHPRTLAQLCYLRRKLLTSSNPVDRFLVGISLGILHGGERLDGSSGYASIAMPNTFSMSPEYVRRFVQTNQLNRLYRDVFLLLRDKTERLFKKHKAIKNVGTVLAADVKEISKRSELNVFKNKIQLILTSPPYLGIVNYAKQNWIRSWFLDKDPLLVSEQLDDDLNLGDWIEFSKRYIIELKQFLRDDGVAVFVIGDVAKSRSNTVPLAREFCLMVRETGLFKNVWCISDAINGFDKTTRIWGESKGSATAIDRIVILSNINPFISDPKDLDIEQLDYRHVLESTKFFIGS